MVSLPGDGRREGKGRWLVSQEMVGERGGEGG